MASLIHAVLVAVAYLAIFDVKGVNCALSCYSCTSAEDANRCGENWPWTNFFNPPQKSSCPIGQCMKAVSGVGSQKVVIRSCTPVCAEVGGSFILATAYTKCCSTDDCNSASAVKVNLVVMLFMAIAAAFWRNV